MKKEFYIYLLSFTVIAGTSMADTPTTKLENTPLLPLATPSLKIWSPVKINDTLYISIDQIIDFYQLNKPQLDGKKITLEGQRTRIQFSTGEQIIQINGINFFLSKPVKELKKTAHISQLDLSSLLDPVLRPSFISNAKSFNTVVLDPGHGGNDKGAANLEASYTLAISKKIHNLLKQKGYRVILTRGEDTAIPLERRLQIANQEKNAILVSLHFNSGDKSVHGMETYIVSASTPHLAGPASVALATAVHSRGLMYLNNPRYGNQLKIKDRGIRHAKFRLLKDCIHPAILIEAGFLTNSAEAQKIASEGYQKALAASIAEGISLYQVSITKKNRKSSTTQTHAQELAASFE